MTERAKPFRAALLVVCFTVLSLAAAQHPSAADLPSPAIEATPAVTTADYLDRYANLLLLRARFAAILKSDIPELMDLEADGIGIARPTPSQVEALRIDLTAELYYYAVNLKYLIWADGAIWPEDQPAQTYRVDALSEIADITGELAAGDVLVLDIDALLRRLEQVNAWTEGFEAPVEDWFSPEERKSLVEDARSAVKGAVQT